MKKTLLALSVACASAFAFGDSAQWTASWIKGIGANATAIDSLDTTGGSWSDDLSSVATFANSTLTIETDEEIAFTVSSEAAATAKTAQKITVKGVFTPCSASDLATGAEMNTKGAQIGFAVVSGTGENSTTIYTYYAWVGKTDGSTAIDDWVSLGTCADSEKETDLTVELSYWGGTPKATFSIKNDGTAVTIDDATKTLTSTAVTSETATLKVGSVACTGSGTLTALDGVAGVAVATVNGTPYATVDDAIAAAKAAADGATVEINADPSGSVTGETGTFDATKECVVAKSGETTTVTIQPKTEIVQSIQFVSKNLMKTDDIVNFRKFLSDNVGTTYNGANSTAEALQTALKAAGTNKLPLWQDYVLGIEPSTTLAMGYAETDSATDKVTIQIPAFKNLTTTCGNYTVEVVDANGTTLTSGTDLSSVQFPMTSAAKYNLKLSFK